jgi:beta-lactam-binding protein with PASTA domain
MTSNLKLSLILLMPFICFIVGYGLCNLVMGNKTHTAPNLVGMTMLEAIEQTSPSHINIQLIAQKECPGVTHGTIVSQKPAPGRLIKSHQSIMVVTAKLPQASLAPDVINKTEKEINNTCSNDHLKLKSYPLQYQLPTGTCIGQIPEKQQPLTDKKLIIYTASNKPLTYLMPSVINKNLEDVVNFLQKQNIQLTIFHKNQKLNPPYPQGLVVTAQKPTPGSFVKLPENMTVQLEVA